MNTEQRLVEMANDGMVSYERIALACLAYMSDDQVDEMARCEELIIEDDTEDTLEFEVSVVLNNGGERFLETFDDEAGDGEFEADAYAGAYSESHQLVVIVERVAMNGDGFITDRTEVTRFEP